MEVTIPAVYADDKLLHMSADNWSACPRCHAKRFAARNKYIQELNKAYGVISDADYLAMVQALEKFSVSDFDVPGLEHETFRVIHSFSLAVNGEVQAKYSGFCTECEYSIDFEYTHDSSSLARLSK